MRKGIKIYEKDKAGISIITIIGEITAKSNTFRRPRFGNRRIPGAVRQRPAGRSIFRNSGPGRKRWRRNMTPEQGRRRLLILYRCCADRLLSLECGGISETEIRQRRGNWYSSNVVTSDQESVQSLLTGISGAERSDPPPE